MGTNGYFHSSLGLAACFYEHTTSRERYWIGFSCTDVGFRSNLVVQINPPAQGVHPLFQGVLAVDKKGKRWILHRGAMSIPGRRISSLEFLTNSKQPVAVVTFSDETIARCLVVACLDESPSIVQKQISIFVRECERIRTFFDLGIDAAAEYTSIEDAESEETEEGNPEKEGSYVVPPRCAKLVDRRHPVVWKALKHCLLKRGLKSTSKRTGRYGPDLRLIGKVPVLFEIKTCVFASAVQQAIGQLLLYDRLLGGRHKKVLVVPPGLGARLANALGDLDIRILVFHWTTRGVELRAAEIDAVLNADD